VTDRLVFCYHLTGREFVLGRLAEYYRAPVWGPVRLLAGPALMAAGLVLRAVARGGIAEGLGAITIGYGLFHLLRPLVRVGLAYQRLGRSSSLEVSMTVDQDGVRVDGAGVAAHLTWTRVGEVTKFRNRYWMTTTSGVRWSFPARAVGDECALLRRLQAQGKWRSPTRTQKVPNTPTEPGPT